MTEYQLGTAFSDRVWLTEIDSSRKISITRLNLKRRYRANLAYKTANIRKSKSS